LQISYELNAALTGADPLDMEKRVKKELQNETNIFTTDIDKYVKKHLLNTADSSKALMKVKKQDKDYFALYTKLNGFIKENSITSITDPQYVQYRDEQIKIALMSEINESSKHAARHNNIKIVYNDSTRDHINSAKVKLKKIYKEFNDGYSITSEKKETFSDTKECLETIKKHLNDEHCPDGLRINLDFAHSSVGHTLVVLKKPELLVYDNNKQAVVVCSNSKEVLRTLKQLGIHKKYDQTEKVSKIEVKFLKVTPSQTSKG
jgi:hypothetical protein